MPSVTCVLDDDQGLRVEVAPHRGGMVISMRWHGEELLYLEPDTYLDPAKNVRGGIPVLFPWAGPLPAGLFGTGKLPQHGMARQAPWQVSSIGPGPCLELSFRSGTASRATYPWDFETRWTYRLEPPGQLAIEPRVVNQDGRAMPFQVGLHPYFRVGPKAQLKYQLPGQSMRDNEDAERPERPFEGQLDLGLGVLDWEVTGLQTRKATLEDPSLGRRLELEWSRGFKYLVIWSLLGKDFLCLEPWTAPRFALQNQQDVLRLEPGVSWSGRVVVRVASLT